MSLLELILIIVVFGGLLWAINVYLPMQPPTKKILNVVVCFVLVLIVLYALGLLDVLKGTKVPKV